MIPYERKTDPWRWTLRCGNKPPQIRLRRGRLALLHHPEPAGKLLAAFMGTQPCRCVQVLLALRHRVFCSRRQLESGVVSREWAKSDGWTREAAALREAAARRYFAPLLRALQGRGIQAEVHWGDKAPWPEIIIATWSPLIVRQGHQWAPHPEASPTRLTTRSHPPQCQVCDVTLVGDLREPDRHVRTPAHQARWLQAVEEALRQWQQARPWRSGRAVSRGAAVN